MQNIGTVAKKKNRKPQLKPALCSYKTLHVQVTYIDRQPLFAFGELLA